MLDPELKAALAELRSDMTNLELRLVSRVDARAAELSADIRRVDGNVAELRKQLDGHFEALEIRFDEKHEQKRR